MMGADGRGGRVVGEGRVAKEPGGTIGVSVS